MRLCASARVFLMGLFVVAVLVFSPSMRAEAASESELQAVGTVFDATYYATNYPDVAGFNGGDQLQLLRHYYYYGIYEGRNASATFNATDYMNKNPDLVSVYGDNLMAYVVHYVNCGMAEGRDATPSNVGVVTESAYTLVGIYTTDYDATVARATNVELAAGNVNNTIVAPGETFSANKAIGPRTTGNGFVVAPVFIGGAHAMGVGGGVCQVSSTIYAAMKTAGITATERHPHSLPVNYLPSGWDATIAGNSLDLKFVNTYDSNLLINTSADSGELTVALYVAN